MAAETNLIKAADLKRVREVDFVERFSDNMRSFLQALGVTRKIPKQAGAALKAYKASGTLESGTVAEGDTIPLSKYKTEPVSYGEIAIKKWRKATSAEAIVDAGYDQAVQMTTEKMLSDVQKGIKSDMFTFMATGTGTATGVGLQKAAAAAWGKLQVLFEDTDSSTVFFMHPEDVADYLGGAVVTTQTAFGMSYIEGFLGLGTVFMNASVPKGKIYATAQDNIVVYYVPVNGADLDQAFSFTSDSTGYIGIHEEADYTNLTAFDTVISGVKIFAERIDGIVVATITAAASTGGPGE
nr:MAG TPA: major capsid protein [Caudoviricetes sp.]